MVLTVSSWFALASSGEIHVAARWASVMSWCEGMTRHLASGEKDTVFLSVGDSENPFDGDWWVESSDILVAMSRDDEAPPEAR